MSLGDGRDGWTPKPSLEISHGDFTFLPSPAVPDTAPVASAPQKRPRQAVTLDTLAAFERSKRRRHPPAALRADLVPEQKRVEATGKPYREAEAAGQTVLEFTEREP